MKQARFAEDVKDELVGTLSLSYPPESLIIFLYQLARVWAGDLRAEVICDESHWWIQT